ncbi:MAG: hypothetical protein GY938_24335 [Ketobacter sp.]|nr:hypothetical protein [Ketobacter sp.]
MNVTLCDHPGTKGVFTRDVSLAGFLALKTPSSLGRTLPRTAERQAFYYLSIYLGLYFSICALLIADSLVSVAFSLL